MGDIATINIDKKTIEGIVHAQMQAAIVGQLEAVKGDLLAKMVDGLLNSRVKDNGEITTDSWYKTTLLEHLAKNKIKEMAQVAITKFFEGHTAEIEKEVLKQMKKNQSSIVKAAVESVQESFTTNFKWAVKIDVVENQK